MYWQIVEIYRNGPFVAHIMSKPDTKFMIWGDLFGALHSLLRRLEITIAMGLLTSSYALLSLSTTLYF